MFDWTVRHVQGILHPPKYAYSNYLKLNHFCFVLDGICLKMMWSCARRRRGKKRKRACYVVLNAYIFESHYFLLEKREISWYFNIYLEGDNSVKTLPCLSDLSFFFKSEKEKSSIFHCHAHTQPCFHPEVTSTITPPPPHTHTVFSFSILNANPVTNTPGNKHQHYYIMFDHSTSH